MSEDNIDFARKIATKHPDYLEHIDQWVFCRDFVEGDRIVKRKGSLYLPRLLGQTDSEYENYLLRALFHAGASRTRVAVVGSILSKRPKIEGLDPETIVGANSESIFTLLERMANEMVTVGRVALLVDSAGSEPWVALYTAESIINWGYEIIKGRPKLSFVVLSESRLDSDDKFTHTRIPIIRVLELIDGKYHMTTYEELNSSSGKSNWVQTDQVIPKRKGGRDFDYIPIEIINVTDLEIEKPPIYDMCVVNHAHYMSCADLELGRHFTALPTPWAAGFGIDGDLSLGSTSAWVTDDPQASCGYLEFTGAGLNEISKGLAHKEELMASLGARLLEAPPNGVEAAETVRMRHSGEKSVLAKLSLKIGAAATTALSYYSDWVGGDPVQVEMNADFDSTRMMPSEMDALMKVYLGGGIDWDTLFFNLQRGEIFHPRVEKEIVRANILTESASREVEVEVD